MKTTFKILFISYSIFCLNSSCSKDDEPLFVIDNYTTTIDENPNNNELIGIIPLKFNGEKWNYSSQLISQSVDNAIKLEGGSSAFPKLSIFVNDATLFDFESNPIITATIEAYSFKYRLDNNSNITYTAGDSKTIIVIIHLNNLAE